MQSAVLAMIDSVCPSGIISDVVLETKVLVSRRLEDRNKVLVLVLVLTKKS